MNSRLSNYLHERTAVLFLLTLLFFAASVKAETVRITTWNLQPSLATTNGLSAQYQHKLIAEASQTIKKLNPDVVLLQEVADWENCDRLVKALEPAHYTIAACSSFLDPQTRKLAKQQVAILTKNKAYLSWSDSWRGNAQVSAPEGGYAFAAIRKGGKNIGFFCTWIDDKTTNASPAQTAQCVGELSAQIETVSHWKANKLQAQFLAGEFDKAADDEFKPFEQLSFQKPEAAPGSEQAVLAENILTRDGGEASRVEISHADLIERPAITSEFDLVAKKLPAVAAALPAPNATAGSTPSIVETKTNQPAVQPMVAKASEPAVSTSTPNPVMTILALALMLVIFLTSLLLVVRSKRARAEKTLVPARSSSMIPTRTASGKILIVPQASEPPYVRIEADGVSQAGGESPLMTNEIPAPVREGLIRHLSAWLKTRFVRRLVSDRAQLMETQQAAALKVLAVDERLTKIERHIQQRNHDYEQRIEALLKELEIAREENRELIRARIAALRAEMEKNERT